MIQLFGREYGKAELLRRVGDISQVGGVSLGDAFAAVLGHPCILPWFPAVDQSGVPPRGHPWVAAATCTKLLQARLSGYTFPWGPQTTWMMVSWRLLPL